MAAFLTPELCSFVITNYLTTCIGWFSMLGMEMEPPSFTGGYYLGGWSFLAVWMIMSLPTLLRGDHRRAKRRPWPTLVKETIFNGEAVGWGTSLQLAIWLFLRATTM